MIERRDVMDFFRDTGADLFRIHLRKPWQTRSGPMVNRKALTSAVLDSRKPIDQRDYKDARVLNTDGTPIVLSCGAELNDHALIYAVLDKLLVQYQICRAHV